MDDVIIDRLSDVFRSHGYEGASLSKLSEATGLQRASLYYRFPGGKKEMAEVVLAQIDSRIATQILDPLRAPGSPAERVQGLVDGLKTLYQNGHASCLLEALSLGEGQNLFGSLIAGAFEAWIDALASVAADSGHDSATAKRLAEEIIISIQGALVLARGRNTNAPFIRVLENLPRNLLAETT